MNMVHPSALGFVRQMDVVEQTLEVAVTLREAGEAMIRLEAMRSVQGVYSVNAYSMEEVKVRGRTAAQVTRSWVTFGLPLISQSSAQAALTEALEALRRHCIEDAAHSETERHARPIRLVA